MLTRSARSASTTSTLLRIGSRRFRVRRREYATDAGVTSSTPYPQPGDQIHGWTLRRIKEVPELELMALQFQHNKTGGQYIHLDKDDKNNVFSIGFKTNPPDRTGVPHILEHITLCGSEKYPVRDPFFKMMPRSLNNFMNAMTYPDHTIYPFATTNHQDFKNLMSVYLDATLHPLLREHDFAQEGWRIGPRDPRTPTSPENPVDFKGVVYNEMKGNVSNADYLFRQKWQDHIFPAINDSGGDPQKMTDLTYGQLKEFQAEHYSATNARIMTYGDIPFTEHLEQLGSEFDRHLNTFMDSELKKPVSLAEGAQTVTVKGPLDPLFPQDQQYKASVSWMMGETNEVVENFAVAIISSLLLEGYSAPLYKNTVEVGWGASYAPNTGYDSSGKIGIFTVGLSGLKRPDVSRLRSGLQNTLRYVKRNGFDKEKIEGRLHQIELELKHKTAHFGMGIVNRLQDGWFNGTDPYDAMSPEEIVEAFRAKNQNVEYLGNLLDKYWLKDNTFTFIMEPSESFGDALKAEEAQRLETKIAEHNSKFPSPQEASKSLEVREMELLEVQEGGGNEDVSCLPTVRVSDIPRTNEQKDLRFSQVGETNVQWRETPTNGLTYFRAFQPLPNLPDELRVYLPLFSSAIQRLGTKELPLETLEDVMRLTTGGLSVSHHAATSPIDLGVCNQGLIFSGTALDRNVPHMLELLRQMVQETNFGKRGVDEKLSELIKGGASTAISDVAEAGHAYARRYAEAGLSEQARLTEQTDGLSQIRMIMDLASRGEHGGMADVIDHLLAIQDFVLKSGTFELKVALTCGAEATAENEVALQRFLEKLPPEGVLPPQKEQQDEFPRNAKSFFPLPYQNYYSALATRTVPYTHADSAPLAVLAQLLTHKRLHPEIREKGGAYGASAYSGALRGVFGMATYRDPSPARSLEVMQQAGSWAAEKSWSERELEEAKLSVFQSVDAPQSVSDEGMSLFLNGVDHTMEQQRRERLLDVSLAQVKDVADKYVSKIGKTGPGLADSNTAVLGPRNEKFGEENGWNQVSFSTSIDAAEERDDGYLVL